MSNAEEEARTFRQRLAAQGVAGAIYGPLTGEAQYLMASDDDWNGLAALQRLAPLCLTWPHGEAQLACVIGERVVWNGTPPLEAGGLAPALCRFAVAADLAFVQIALAPTAEGLRVVAVDHHPQRERFGDSARHEIVTGLVQLLTARADPPQAGATTRERAIVPTAAGR